MLLCLQLWEGGGVPHPVLIGEGFTPILTWDGGTPSPRWGTPPLLGRMGYSPPPPLGRMGYPPTIRKDVVSPYQEGCGSPPAIRKDGVPPLSAGQGTPPPQGMTDKLKTLPSLILRMRAVKIRHSLGTPT